MLLALYQKMKNLLVFIWIVSWLWVYGPPMPREDDHLRKTSLSWAPKQNLRAQNQNSLQTHPLNLRRLGRFHDRLRFVFCFHGNVLLCLSVSVCLCFMSSCTTFSLIPMVREAYCTPLGLVLSHFKDFCSALAHAFNPKAFWFLFPELNKVIYKSRGQANNQLTGSEQRKKKT